MNLYTLIALIISYFLLSYFFEFYRLKIAKIQIRKIDNFLDNWELIFIQNLYVELDDDKIIRQYSNVFNKLNHSIVINHKKNLLIGKPTIFKIDFFKSNVINKELYSKVDKIFREDNNLEKTIYLLPEIILLGEKQLNKLIKPEIFKIIRKELNEDQEECKRLKKKVKKKFKKEYYPKNADVIRNLFNYNPKWLNKHELYEYIELLQDIIEELREYKPIILEKEIAEFYKKLNNKYSSYFEKDRKLKEYFAKQKLADAYEKIIYRFISLKHNLNNTSEKDELKQFSNRIDCLKENFTREDLENWKINNDFQKKLMPTSVTSK